MKEHGPMFRFEAYEATHNPEKGGNFHSSEVEPDETCGATVEPLKQFESDTQGSIITLVSCEKCTILEGLSTKGPNLDTAQSTALKEARELVKNECTLWKIRQTGTPAPEWFLPKSLDHLYS